MHEELEKSDENRNQNPTTVSRMGERVENWTRRVMRIGTQMAAIQK